jgi:ParB/RepB/Spo0J family partition protein
MASASEATKPRELLLLDPSVVAVSRANPRCDTPFDEKKNAPLIGSIRRFGQHTPVPVRRNGEGYELIAGTRRLGAVRLLHKEDATFKLRACLVNVNDGQAWRIAYSENEDRKDITGYQTARTWKYCLDHLCGGVQDQLARIVQRDKTTVSHTLALLEIPDDVRFALKDPEGISVNFGTKLLRALRSDHRKAMIRKAKQIASSDQKCSPNELLRALLHVAGEAAAGHDVVELGSEPGAAVLRRSRKGVFVLTIKPQVVDAPEENRADLHSRIEQEVAKVLRLDSTVAETAAPDPHNGAA